MVELSPKERAQLRRRIKTLKREQSALAGEQQSIEVELRRLERILDETRIQVHRSAA